MLVCYVGWPRKFQDGWDSKHTRMYSTDLKQRRTHTRVVGHPSPCARTRSSVSFSGFELRLELRLERKLEQAVQQTENINKGAY